MKNIAIIGLIFLLIGCGDREDNEQQLQQKIDSLQKELSQTYKPGLGEFMSGIQLHHAKLWFAGQSQNWPLAKFEIDEIGESLEDIRTYCKDRPEIKSLPMIDPAIDSVTASISQQDITRFKNAFIVLTNTCNSCHKATDHAFNVIKIPDNPPLSNQQFNP